MIGVLISILAGVAMSFQGVFNTKLSEKIGLWETNTFVQGSAFIVTLIITYFFGKGSFKDITTAKKIYLLGGILGVVIIFTVMMGIKSLGTTCSIAIILVAQLIAAALIDAFGLFDTDKITFGVNEIIGIILMIIGIVIFKWKF